MREAAGGALLFVPPWPPPPLLREDKHTAQPIPRNEIELEYDVTNIAV